MSAKFFVVLILGASTLYDGQNNALLPSVNFKSFMHRNLTAHFYYGGILTNV
jgi:hypothetical protein